MSRPITTIEEIERAIDFCDIPALRTLQVANMQRLNINPRDYVTDPQLLSLMWNVMRAPDTIVEQLWDNYQTAYAQLTADGFFQDDLSNSSQKQINIFKGKISGPHLLKLNEISEHTYVVCKASESVSSDIYFEYNRIIDLIEAAYGVESRDFFEASNDLMTTTFSKKYISENEEYIKELASISPVKSMDAAKMAIIDDNLRDIQDSFDFWGVLVDKDFENVSNGGMVKLWNPEDADESSEAILYRMFKQCIFKELSPVLSYYGFDSGEYIKFLVKW